MVKKERSDTMKKYDIAVIGGGFAGVAAALAAAREGARVIIIEKQIALAARLLIVWSIPSCPILLESITTL